MSQKQSLKLRLKAEKMINNLLNLSMLHADLDKIYENGIDLELRKKLKGFFNADTKLYFDNASSDVIPTITGVLKEFASIDCGDYIVVGARLFEVTRTENESLGLKRLYLRELNASEPEMALPTIELQNELHENSSQINYNQKLLAMLQEQALALGLNENTDQITVKISEIQNKIKELEYKGALIKEKIIALQMPKKLLAEQYALLKVAMNYAKDEKLDESNDVEPSAEIRADFNEDTGTLLMDIATLDIEDK